MKIVSHGALRGENELCRLFQCILYALPYYCVLSIVVRVTTIFVVNFEDVTSRYGLFSCREN